MQAKHLDPISIVIPAAVGVNRGVFGLPVSGRIVTVLAASGPFIIRPDSGYEFPLNQGRHFGEATSREFGFLSFYNPDVAPVTAQIIVSDEPYEPDKVVTLGAVSVTVQGKDAPATPRGQARQRCSTLRPPRSRALTGQSNGSISLFEIAPRRRRARCC